jgi:hypothetical protein
VLTAAAASMENRDDGSIGPSWCKAGRCAQVEPLVELTLWRLYGGSKGLVVRYYHLVQDELAEDPARRQQLCPGRNPPFWGVKRPARPHRSATQNRLFT